MITQKTKATGTVAVWAIPTSEWERQRDETLGVFKYVLSTCDRYESGAVKVHEYSVALTVPGGIDLLQRAVATLMEAKDKVLGEAQRRAEEIQKQINQLLCLPAPTETLEGEYHARDDKF